MDDDQKLPLLLTPGPLTTHCETRLAMRRDWGSRDKDFIELTARVRSRLLAATGLNPEDEVHTTVLLQGSGTFIMEAALQSLIPRDGKVLVLVNGAYGDRVVEICRRAGLSTKVIETAQDVPPDPLLVGQELKADQKIANVVLVHCETTSGILNPLAAVADVVGEHGRKLIVDAMSSFGALPIPADHPALSALVSSSNKCLEGVPGIGFAVVKTDVIKQAAGQAATLSLDLYDQWSYMETSGQWRFTPPTHVLAAFDKALQLHEEEGGAAGRLHRYKDNAAALIGGMRSLGFETFIGDNLQAPVIVTFLEPADPAYDFAEFYEKLYTRGFVIYPGKLTERPSFRIGCIGQITSEDMHRAVKAVETVCAEMGVQEFRPSAA